MAGKKMACGLVQVPLKASGVSFRHRESSLLAAAAAQVSSRLYVALEMPPDGNRALAGPLVNSPS
eukprot:SAG31_NODE_7979_length_1550_cov_1.048243_3_plen_64_part_01